MGNTEAQYSGASHSREPYNCTICGHVSSNGGSIEEEPIRSNVRRFVQEQFPVWRCPDCGSLHSGQEVDLAYYYSHYPFLEQDLDVVMRMAYTRLLRRMRRAGLTESHRILDYGCGGGCFVDFLTGKGYRASGYDPFSEKYGTLDSQEPFDCTVALDVVEHDPDPVGILRKLDSLTAPGGLIVIGTPNASGIRLGEAERYIHELHQPYHRHIFSKEALCSVAERTLGWTPVAYYPTPHLNIPGINVPLIHHYSRSVDGTLDVLFERKPDLLRFWLNPWTYFLMVFGYHLCGDADMLVIFSKSREGA